MVQKLCPPIQKLRLIVPNRSRNHDPETPATKEPASTDGLSKTELETEKVHHAAGDLSDPARTDVRRRSETAVPIPRFPCQQGDKVTSNFDPVPGKRMPDSKQDTLSCTCPYGGPLMSHLGPWCCHLLISTQQIEEV